VNCWAWQVISPGLLSLLMMLSSCVVMCLTWREISPGLLSQLMMQYRGANSALSLAGSWPHSFLSHLPQKVRDLGLMMPKIR
jgi:hypothetical protein